MEALETKHPVNVHNRVGLGSSEIQILGRESALIGRDVGRFIAAADE